MRLVGEASILPNGCLMVTSGNRVYLILKNISLVLITCQKK